MKPAIVRYAVCIALAAFSGIVPAVPFSVAGDSGLPGTPVVVTLNDGSTLALEAAMVVIDFNPSRLDYVSSVLGSLFPNGTIVFENLLDEPAGRVTLGVSGNPVVPLTGASGSLLDVNFAILAGAPAGLTAVTFRCLPVDPVVPIDNVIDQSTANDLCAPDYAIPPTSGNVNVLAVQVPVSSTGSLALLGLGLMAWMRRKLASEP